MPLRYAVHGYTWTPSWSNSDLWVIDRAKEMGLDAIEIPLLEPEGVAPAAIAERVRANDLAVLGSLAMAADADPSHEDPVVRARGLQLLQRCTDLTADMGGSLLTGVIFTTIGRRINRKPEERDYLRTAEVLKEAARYAQGRGVALGVEAVNRYESFLINTAAQALYLCDLIDEPNVGVHLDTYHMNIEETDFYSATRAAVPRLVHVHLSESHRGIPGTGTVDWDSLMRGLADGEYSGYVGLESFFGISPAMRAATCIWRTLAPDADTLVREGLAHLKARERAHFPPPTIAATA